MILIVVLLPFWTSVLVRSYAWMVLLGRHGLINEALLASGLIDRPLRILNTSLADPHRDDPHPAAVHDPADRQRAAADRSRRCARAAAGLGAPPWTTFRQVTLPLSMPGVAAGVLLVFVLSLGFYITPALVGGPRDITLSMLIAQQVDQLNWAYAACLSAVLLATALVIIARLPAPARHRQRLQDERAMTSAACCRSSGRSGLILLFLALADRRRDGRSRFRRRPISPFRRRPSACAGTAPISAAENWLRSDLAQPVGRRLPSSCWRPSLGTLAALGLARLPPAAARSWPPA